MSPYELLMENREQIATTDWAKGALEAFRGSLTRIEQLILNAEVGPVEIQMKYEGEWKTIETPAFRETVKTWNVMKKRWPSFKKRVVLSGRPIIYA